MWERLKEPSSYAGLASIISGFGVLAKADEAPAIADAIVQSAPFFTTSNWFGGFMVLFGAAALIVKEKGK